MPDHECGYEDWAAVAPASANIRLEDCGLELAPRRVVANIAELFVHTCGARPRAVALWGPPGTGVETAVHDLARIARIHGFIPLRPSMIDTWTTDIATFVHGRSLCLIVDEGSAEGWARLVEWSLRSPMPHVLLFVARREVPLVDGLELEPLPASVLAGAIQPSPTDEGERQRIHVAAGRAQGSPGRFVRLLWGGASANDAPTDRTRVSRAAEQPTTYGEGDQDRRPPAPARGSGCALWPDPRELTRLRQRMDAAVGLIERGRYEPGERALRQATGSLARRHDWESAARGGLALARCLLRRGRPCDAQVALDKVREYVARAAATDSPLWVDTAVLAGGAATDRGRLDEAECTLHGAVSAASAIGDAGRITAARLALARCLFWRGRYDEADRTVVKGDPGAGRTCGDAGSIRVAVAASRIAIGRGDFGAAISLATGALEGAERLAQPAAVAEAAYGSAFAHLVVGDRVAMERDISLCLQSARAARDPLCGFRARLIGVEQDRRGGRSDTSAAFLSRIARIPASNLPSTIRARCAMLMDLMSASGSVEEVVARHVSATGLHALALFAPGCVAPAHKREQAAMDDVLEIMRCCQSAEEGRTLLNGVVARLRERVSAVAIACVAPDGMVLASDGGRLGPRMAERVLAAGQTIAPHLCDGTIEGGAPVRYGGEPIAVLVGRWAVGTPYDPSRAAMAITVAATAAGPAAAEAIARSRQSPAPALGEILGLSPVMDDVRRSIERAAAAPFAVLIEGESGSGKELVARALHRHGPRHDRPFCSINCAALPDELVESELFGHARGAFTGAATARSGVFEEAHGGTLFLDEIGELSARAQAKVLRVMQDGELRRVGENLARRVDVRIVAATNRDLRRESAAGRFRLDLLYRLDVVRIVVPPLRERSEDIAVLADRFWQETTARIGSHARLSTATLGALARYHWPGNVRELQNVLAALAVRSPKRGVIPPTALPPPFANAPSAESWRLDAARRLFEERFVRAALVRTAGRRTQAAEQLGVTRQGLAKLMTRLGINASE